MRAGDQGKPGRAALAARLERVALRPGEISSPLASLVRPLLRSLRWKPKYRKEELEALFASMRGGDPGASGGGAGGDLQRKLALAEEELAGNIALAERACVVYGAVDVAQIAWLRRVLEVLAQTEVLLADPAPAAPEGAARARAREGRARRARIREAEARLRASALEPLALGPAGAPAPRAAALRLAAVDHLLEAARGEHEMLSHRRGLFEAARALLLEVTAELPPAQAEPTPRGAEARFEHIAQEIVRIDRLEAAGIDGRVGLLHQARSAASSGDRARLYAALVALDGASVQAGDAEALSRTARAIDALGADADRDGADARSLELSAAQVLGERAVGAARAARLRARRGLGEPPPGAKERALHELASRYLAPEADDAILPFALASDGCFEVGGTLSPVRVYEEETRLRAVDFPTQRLILLPAKGASDLPSALVEDPRTLLLSLATGRLLTRKFVAESRVSRPRTELRGEARVYVLDGSTSMMDPDDGRRPEGAPAPDERDPAFGARARMRDAILLAELSTLMRRYDEARGKIRVVLYYRYFTKKVGPLDRVDSSRAALAAIGEVLGTVRTGGTDIEKALASSFEQVREARASDPDLGRAQIVLVTDGDAEVREEIVEEGRRGMEDLPIQLSVIALGEENPALRRIVAAQRSRGERAFYHFVSDEALARMARPDWDAGRALHLPELAPPPRAKRGSRGRAKGEAKSALGAEIGDLLEELAELRRRREGGAAQTLALEEADLDAMTFGEETLGKLDARVLGPGAAAKREAARRDRRALTARFDRWFPPSPAAPGDGAAAPPAADLEAARIVLETVSESLFVVGGSPFSRLADAIDLVARLLPDAGLSPARFRGALLAGDETVSAALASLRALCMPREPRPA